MTSKPSIDARIAEIASRQSGYVTRAQLRAAGISDRAVRRRVDDHELIATAPRTLRVAGAPVHPNGDLIALCLAFAAVASHLTALWLHGVVDRPEVTHLATHRRRSTWTASLDGVRLHTSTNLPPDDILVVDGVPTLSVARALMTTAGLVPREVRPSELLDMVSAAVETGVATLSWLWWMLEVRRCRGRTGVSAFEAALAARSSLGPTESWLEREMLRLLDEAGLPRPVVQRVVRRDGRFAARVDLFYEPDIVIEVLGYAFHRTREQQMADAERMNMLQNQGHRVYQIVSRAIAEDPAGVIATVAEALALRAR